MSPFCIRKYLLIKHDVSEVATNSPYPKSVYGADGGESATATKGGLVTGLRVGSLQGRRSLEGILVIPRSFEQGQGEGVHSACLDVRDTSPYFGESECL